MKVQNIQNLKNKKIKMGDWGKKIKNCSKKKKKKKIFYNLFFKSKFNFHFLTKVKQYFVQNNQ